MLATGPGERHHRSNLHSTVNLRQITIWNHLGWLIADTNLETSWAPVNELDGALGLKSSNRSIHIFGHNITTVQQASSHILSVAWVALHHLVVRLAATHRHLLDRVGFVRCLSGRNYWCVSNKREMDTWVWNQIGLELIEINIEGAIETEGGSDGRDNYNIY